MKPIDVTVVTKLPARIQLNTFGEPSLFIMFVASMPQLYDCKLLLSSLKYGLFLKSR